MIRAEAITVRRDGRTLADGVSIAVSPGELAVIVGPNGAGKSTLLKTLSGDLAPDAGQVALLGRPLAAWPRREIARLRAVLPQNSPLRFAFRVRDVVRLGRLPFPSAPGDGRIVAEALAAVGLTDRADQLYPLLSGGEQRRVQLARVLAQIDDAARAGRGVLLLDEPTAALDPAQAMATLAHARRLARAGLTVLAVVHDVNMATPFADTFIGMREGRVIFSGPVAAAVNAANLQALYGLRAVVTPHPETGTPLVAFVPPGTD